jgi:serine/threonine protein kinase
VMRVVQPSIEYEIDLGSSIGKGGEGEVLSVAGRTDIVAKVIHKDRRTGQDSLDRKSKLVAQIQSRPSSKFLCWPSGLLFDKDEWVGFVMPAVGVDALPWASFSNFYSRSTQAPDFDMRYALTAVRNLCAAFEVVHASGGVVGDVNESNILVGSDASVWVIDCDSQQFASKDGFWYCPVGKEEFCAPELVGVDFKTSPRTASSDVFGFAVLAFQMLSGGSHPFDAISINDADLSPLAERISKRQAPLLSPSSTLQAPPRVPVKALPPAFVDLVTKSLLNTPDQRPSLRAWSQALREIDSQLQSCKKVENHLYTQSKSCPWCRHMKATGFDVWSSPGTQQTLPSIDLKTRKDVRVERKQSAATPSSQQSVSFHSYLGLMLAHPVTGTRYFWRRAPLATHLEPPARIGSGPSVANTALLIAGVALSVLSLSSPWLLVSDMSLSKPLTIARWAALVFGSAGLLFYLKSLFSQSRYRILAFSIHDLWRLPIFTVYSAVFWSLISIIVAMDAAHRLARYLYWLWRSN